MKADYIKWIGFIIGIVILFSVIAELAPDAMEAGDSLNDSNVCESAGCFYNDSLEDCFLQASNGTCSGGSSLPLSRIFAGAGVIFLIIMAFVLIAIVKRSMKK